MSDLLHFPLPVLLLGWMLGGGSPGPATLAISSTSMALGRRQGLALATGIIVGSATWGIAAALGFAAIMQANVWVAEVIRYLGAGYLFYLALKSLRSAWMNKPLSIDQKTSARPFRKGLMLHLTNPKAMLGWGSIYAIALVPEAGTLAIWLLFDCLITASAIVFWGYALLFSSRPIASAYAKAKRWFELAFGVLFGLASLKILTVRLQ